MQFVIWAPWRYHHRSGGMRALYFLADDLRRLKHDVLIGPLLRHPGNDALPFAELECTDDREPDPDAFHVYPEFWPARPGTPKPGHAIHWLMQPQKFAHGAADLVFTWDEAWAPNDPRLMIDIVEHDLFFDTGAVRNLTLWYAGKGHVPPGWSPPPDSIEITSESPASRAEMASLLQRAKVLVCWDPLTALRTEAYLCGCPLDGVGADFTYRAPDTKGDIARLVRICRKVLKNGPVEHGPWADGITRPMVATEHMWWRPAPGSRSTSLAYPRGYPIDPAHFHELMTETERLAMN